MRRRDFIEDDARPVMVPRNTKILVPISPERVGRLREHLATVLLTMKGGETPSPERPGPDGFAARVARAGCSLCKGWCCRNGADDGFLDDRTLARVRAARPELDAPAVVRLYTERAPRDGYDGSCIFHGGQGCTLDRSMRSDVCNAHFCGGLSDYLASSDAVSPTVIIAGEGDTMRTSPILLP